MKPLLFLSLVTSVLGGCAMTSSHHSGPSGRPVHYIDGMTASVTYRKANELCPSGYDIIGQPEQRSPVDYVMTIECKASRAAQRAPQFEPVSERQTTNQEVGAFASSVRNLPEVRACNQYPVPQLNVKGNGFEKFTVTCSDGDALSVRCDRTGCRVLQ